MIDLGIKSDLFYHVVHYKRAQILCNIDALISCTKGLELIPDYQLAIQAIQEIETKISRSYTMLVYA